MTDQQYLVAVYGSLRKGMGNHGLLDNDESVLLSTEQIPGFEMYSYGAYPFIRPADTEQPITIEVYAVSSSVMQRLDRLEGYPSFYNRKLVQTSKGQAWIYFIDQPGNNRPVQHGDWVKYRTGASF